LYASPDINTVMHGQDNKSIQNLVRKPNRKRPLRRPRHRREDIKMALRKTEWEDVNWIHLVQDRDQ